MAERDTLRVEGTDEGTVDLTVTVEGKQSCLRLTAVDAHEVGTRLIVEALTGNPPRREFSATDTLPTPPPSETPGAAGTGDSAVTVPVAYEGMLDENFQRDWRLTRSARRHASEIGVTHEEMLAAASSPERIDLAPGGDAVSHSRAGVSVLIPDQDPEAIIGVRLDPKTRRQQADTRRAASGGPGRQMPGSFSELTDLLTAHGFTVEHGKGHPKVRHPDKPGQVTVPLSTSDHRGFQNMVATVRAEFGVDITRPAE